MSQRRDHPKQDVEIKLLDKEQLKQVAKESVKTATKSVPKIGHGGVSPFFKNFLGYWLLESIDDWMGSTMIRFFIEDDQAKAKFYSGTQKHLREISLADVNVSAFFDFGDLFAVPVQGFNNIKDTIQVEVLSNTSLRLLNVTEEGVLPLSSDELTSTFKIQSFDNDLAYSQLWTLWDGTSDSKAYGEIENLMRFKRLDYEPEIQTRDEPVSGWSNPVNIFNYVYETYLYISQTERRDSAQCEQFIGNPELKALKKKLMKYGVIRANTIDISERENKYVGVWPSVNNSGITTFRLAHRNYFNTGSRIHVSGFIGPYAVLNGEHSMSVAYEGSRGPKYKPTHQLPESAIFTIHIDFDSTGLPPYDPLFHGIGALWAQHGPVNKKTGYRDMFAALVDLQDAFGISTHSRVIGFYGPNGKIYDTFDELAEGLANNTWANLDLAQGRKRGQNQGRDVLYFNPTTPGNGPSSSSPIFDINDPYGLGQVIMASDSKWDVDIDLDNYMEKVYDVWYTVTGPILPNEPITEQYGGSQVRFKTSKAGKTPDPLVDEYGTHEYIPYVNRNMVGGIVDREYTTEKYRDRCGECRCKTETVAYIRFRDELGYDGAGDLTMRSLVFGRNDMPHDKFLSNHIASLASLLEKLNKYKPDRYILDIRENNGGVGSMSSGWASLFGGNREAEGHIFIMDFANDPLKTKTITGSTDLETVNGGAVANANAGSYLNTDRVAEIFPKAMVRGKCGKTKEVVILNNVNAASGGDTFPHNFIGPNKRPKGGIHDLGKNVTCQIVGDLDGRLYNGIGLHAVPIDNPNPFVWKDPNLPGGEVSLPPVFLTLEQGIGMADDAHGTICNQQTWTEPSKLVPSWYEKQWQDIGIIDLVHKYPLGRKKCKPDYENNHSWRDLGLEHAITN